MHYKQENFSIYLIFSQVILCETFMKCSYFKVSFLAYIKSNYAELKVKTEYLYHEVKRTLCGFQICYFIHT